jgi:phosphate-selective porin OprO and OprP
MFGGMPMPMPRSVTVARALRAVLGVLAALAVPAVAVAQQPDSAIAAAPAADTLPARPDAKVPPVVFDDRGIVFTAADSTMQVIMRFRVQLWGTAIAEEGEPTLFNGQVRRLRLRFGGFLLDPRLTYNLQLSFSRGDQDFEDTGFANIVRDAAVAYQFTPNLQATFGQTKLPGNRQRVISSGDIQFPNRSIVNGTFNIDRDMLLMGTFRDTLGGGVPLHVQAVVSSGEGRNTQVASEGLAWTGRVEVLPLGAFLRGGDYFEGDLMHEPKPRLSVGVTWSLNENALRTGGQLGPPLWSPRTMTTVLADALLKYQGLAVYAEYAYRDADDPVTTRAGEAPRFVYTGHGALLQASYHIKELNLEPGARVAFTDPTDALEAQVSVSRTTTYEFVLVRYWKGHRVKTQLEFGILDYAAQLTVAARREWLGRLGVELGI